MRKFLPLIFLLVLLTACGHNAYLTQPLDIVVIEEFEDEEVVAVDSRQDEIIYLDLRLEIADYKPARFEPEQGTILGAYIERDIRTSSMGDFDRYLGVKHGIFEYTLRLGEDYPLRWILQNIANFSIPLITLLPPDEEEIFNLELIADFAQSAANLNIPLFVQLFPAMQGHSFVPTEYVQFFRDANRIFTDIAPNIVLVWGVDTTRAGVARHFYPGDDYVDWVKLTVYNDIDETGNFSEFFGVLDAFYFEFNSTHPIMLGLAVSHYSSASNRHFPVRAAEKLAQIYDGIAQNYPRVKAVIYRNYSDLDGRGGIYSINGTQVLADAYRNAVSIPHYINLVAYEDLQQRSIVIQTPYQAVMQGFDFFIPWQVVARFDEYNVEEWAKKQTHIGGNAFYPMGFVYEMLDLDFFVNHTEGFLVLQ